MKKIIGLIFLSFLMINSANATHFIQKTVDGYTFRILKIDTKSDDFNFKVGVNPDYGASDLRTIMEKNNGISAINGVFFCPADYAECWGQDSTKNERYYRGYKIHTTPTTEHRVVFAVDREGRPFIFQSDKINTSSEGKIYYGMSNFPLLLWNGESTYQDYVDQGLIDSKMKAKMTRNFICHDESRRYIYTGYVSAITLDKLPNLLLKIGCYNALNLDAGASSSFIYNARQIIGPGRDILDAVVIEREGLDTSLIISAVDESITKVRNRLSNTPYEQQVIFIDTVVTTLNNMRSSMYEKYSYNTYGEDGYNNGYEIYIKDVPTLTKAYMYNYLTYSLNVLKSELSAEESIRKQQQKDEQDKKNGLF